MIEIEEENEKKARALLIAPPAKKGGGYRDKRGKRNERIYTFNRIFRDS